MTRTWKISLSIMAAAVLVASPFLFFEFRPKHNAKEIEVPLGLNEEAMQKIARFGEGFIVWERFKGGSWEIWTKQLEGGQEERLVPEEPGKDHFCPKISPDGKQMAYMSYDRGTNAYPAFRGKTAALWIMNLVTQERRVIVPEARSYAEDRAVTWRDDQTLCYINEKGETVEMDLDSGRTRKVLQHHEEDFGFLPSPDLRYATTGTPEFATVDADGTIRHQKVNDGCQPYFTSNSQWGYWMGGAGGPIKAMNLETGEEKNLLERDDPRLPERRNYVYFPMVSPGMRLLAFAASPDKHDHFDADYDIYLALLNPHTMTVLGRPVRYTNFSGCDRFPDVFRRELPLGTHYVEGETTVTFSGPKNKGVYEFDFDDGGHAHGASVSHTFKKPGDYWVSAISIHENGRNLRGFVHVDPPSPPRVIVVRRDGERDLFVEFNEEIDIARATAHLEGGKTLAAQLVEGGRAMFFRLPADLPREASLILEGVCDRAQSANTLARQVLLVPRTDWPVTTGGLVFGWGYAKTKNQLPDGTECRVTPHGLAFWSEDEAMQLRGGWFDAPEAGRRISEALRKSGAFTVEAVVTPQQKDKGLEIESILTLGGSKDDANLVVGQRGFQLCVALRSRDKPGDPGMVLQDVANISPGGGHHLLVTFEKGSVIVYLDGKTRELPGVIKDGLSGWTPQELRFGAGTEGTHPWRGLLERVAFYDRAMKRDEAMLNAKSASVVLDGRTKPREWEVMARLVESSPPPTLQEIQPYKEALVRQLYEVVHVLSGDETLPKEIVVTQWAWLGGEPMPAQALKAGDVVRLTLHEMETHRGLASLFVKDSLSSGFDAKQYFDAGEWDEVIEKQ